MRTSAHTIMQALTRGLVSACFLLASPFVMQGTAQNDETPEIEVSSRLTYTEQFEQSYRVIPDRVPTGYLYDRVYPFANLTETVPCDTTEPYDLYQAWSEIERSAVHPHLPKNYDAMRERVNLSLLKNIVPIVGIDFRMAEIDTLAVDQGRIIAVGEQLTDAGLQSPYTVFHATRFGITQDKFYSDVAYTILFSPENFLTNTGAMVKRLRLSIPGFDPVWLNPNEPYEITGLEGNEPWKIEVEIVENNETRVICSQSKVHTVGPYNPPPVGNCILGERMIVESDIPFKGYLENSATTSLANAHIFYRLTPTGIPCKLHKPIIVVDGFDPKDIRKMWDVYNLMNYKDDKLFSKNLNQELRLKGYDVIVLNLPILGDKNALDGRSDVKAYKSDGTYQGKVELPGRDGGSDYIERNAFLLVKLIQMVNSHLRANGSAEELVVVGPSMGGVISRYALAYMEQEDAKGVSDMDHNTRLWVSFDAPQKGANISAGMQAAVDHYAFVREEQQSKDLYENYLKSVAARQLLVFSTERDTNKYHSNDFHKNLYRNLTKNGMNYSNGYPQNVRKISLLNGTLNGTSIANECDFDIWVDANKAGIQVFKYIVRHAPKFGQKCLVFESKYPITVKIGKKKILRKVDPALVEGDHKNYGEMQDAYPGSYFTDGNEMVQKIVKNLKDGDIKNINVYYDEFRFTFISSASALDIDLGSGLTYDGDYSTRRLNCEGLTPFDDYYAPTKTEEHTSITASNALWLMQEIEKGKPNCEPVCAEKLNWPETVCNGRDDEFEITNLPKNTAHGIRWQVSGAPLSVTSGHTARKATIAANSTGNAIYADVTATVVRYCGSDYVLKGRVEVPSVDLEITGNEDICQGKKNIYELSSTSPLLEPYWYFADNHGIYTGASPYSNVSMPENANNDVPYTFTKAAFGGSRVGQYKLIAKAENHCGEQMKAEKMVQIVAEQFCSNNKRTDESDNQLNVYPNPGTTEWLVQIKGAEPRRIKAIFLTDLNGRLIHGDEYAAEGVAFEYLSANDLAKGIYILKVMDTKGMVYNQKLIKK